MKIYHSKKKAPVARPGKKYIDHERYWGSIVKFSNSTWYNYATLFSPCGTKANQLPQTTFDMFAKDAEHIYEGISQAEYRHFKGLIERASITDLAFMQAMISDTVMKG